MYKQASKMKLRFATSKGNFECGRFVGLKSACIGQTGSVL